MSTMLLNYFPLLLLFLISFSSQIVNDKINPTKQIEMISLISQPKLYDFLIYPSNDKFKYCILPFLSSENLLKIYFHFLNLYPNLRIQKFLPGSTVETTVLDWQKSYFAYIFKNEFSFFNPIIFDSEQNYRAVSLGHSNRNIKDDAIYALLSPNQICPFKSHALIGHNHEVFYASYGFDFFVAEKKREDQLKIIANGEHSIRIHSHEYFDCISEAHNFNRCKKFYFTVFDLYDRYRKYIEDSRWWGFVMSFDFEIDSPWTFKNILSVMFSYAFSVINFFPMYHLTVLPFHILAFPFEFVFFQYNYFALSGFITKSIVYLWALPSLFQLVFVHVYVPLIFAKDNDFQKVVRKPIKPQAMKWAVAYIRGKKDLANNYLHEWAKIMLQCLIFVGIGLLYTLPLAPFMMLQGESNE